MSMLLVKPNHKHDPLHIAISHENDIYAMPDLTDVIDYTPTHKLEINEWFKINCFLDKGFHNDFICEERINPADYLRLDANKFAKSKYICVEEKGFKFFQKLVTSNFICKKMFDFNNASFVENGNYIAINKLPDAAYDIDNDTLYFKDLSRINSLFDNIDSLYRDATTEEVDTFLNSDLICPNAAKDFNVGIPNRKKIALALEKLERFTVEDKKVINRYIKQYYPQIPHENNKFVISTDVHLKYFIYGVEERFYTTFIGQEQMVASSVISLRQ
ncbi:hypothetical protein Sps_04710 [Shewanella psychrophila]|uniref:Uncharacterized protein n=1 Tax=Shewanella psychrophila TaxID=225848 RepID=A0A1S6HW71_9GAMM|nr:hypothetical protein [Shewanella psychrophila]AQS39793.1 hypothetical protein Sps_04710 [Shewanella psychrophila]